MSKYIEKFDVPKSQSDLQFETVGVLIDLMALSYSVILLYISLFGFLNGNEGYGQAFVGQCMQLALLCHSWPMHKC
jgi:hypothetical protein